MSHGFELRPFQKEAIEFLSKKKTSSHVLCVAPTGSGKSLIYEKIAVLAKTRTLLVTPLVALARQQKDRLAALGISVSLGTGDPKEGPPEGETGAWIVSPEFLSYSHRGELLRRWKPNFLVMDECHCLWEWGEEFRPAFTQIPELIKKYKIRRSLWLTATLPPLAREHLRGALSVDLKEVGSFELPPKLKLNVVRVPWSERPGALVHTVKEMKGAGIVFAGTRQSSERLAGLLEATGLRTAAYHAGMSSEERRAIEAGLRLGKLDVIVATSAFGMGMDYPELKWVILWQAPGSLLSLAQTVGRVGRNISEEAQALVFWDNEDFRLNEWMVQDSARRRNELLRIRDYLFSFECREVGLKRYFNLNSGLMCSEPVCGRCDVCAG